MTLFETGEVLKHWAEVFNRKISQTEIETWAKIFQPFTSQSFGNAFKRYYESMEKHHWPTPKAVKAFCAEALNESRSSSPSHPVKRPNQSEYEFLEYCCGPDWKEKTERGIAWIRHAGIPYGGNILLPKLHWLKLGVSLPESNIEI
jgi:hypothetical protein